MQQSIATTLRWAGLTLAFATMAGCGGGDSGNGGTTPNSEWVAVIAGVANDYSSSEVSIASAEAPYDVVEGYASSNKSDMSVAAYGDSFYRIGRFNQDNISKYNYDSPGVSDWQFTTNDDGESLSNPYDIIFVSDTKAYVLRYGDSSIWVVNPSVALSDEDLFKTGEIDLSSYDDDGVPEMSAGVIYNGKLYVVMQNMDADFAPGTAYLAVINVATNEEINISGGAQKGLALNIKNPHTIIEQGGSIFIAGLGRYDDTFSSPARPAEYTGGIEVVNPSTYDHYVLIDDGNDVSHPYGLITDMTIVSNTVGYFNGYEEFQKTSLYRFNPSTGEVVASAIPGTASVDLRSIAASPTGELWFGIGGANPDLVIANTSTETIIKTIGVNKNPAEIVFAEKD
ncbi:hypothetical protein O5O45_21420 [Hahella aquimaris]|uniref:hypothetical protein n=1 Tax=Hahella sp. HNIBRBA332 TaxID=3015983 RepID=UPI00273B3526|nr:hypothetical protein [Hahella sp. HNIBRBA332]WLQ12289.1 hypothetical protein O5O45_21420 [Hahella sp. HNIBRBA332]